MLGYLARSPIQCDGILFQPLTSTNPRVYAFGVGHTRTATGRDIWIMVEDHFIAVMRLYRRNNADLG